ADAPEAHGSLAEVLEARCRGVPTISGRAALASPASLRGRAASLEGFHKNVAHRLQPSVERRHPHPRSAKAFALHPSGEPGTLNLEPRAWNREPGTQNREPRTENREL